MGIRKTKAGEVTVLIEFANKVGEINHMCRCTRAPKQLPNAKSNSSYLSTTSIRHVVSHSCRSTKIGQVQYFKMAKETVLQDGEVSGRERKVSFTFWNSPV